MADTTGNGRGRSGWIEPRISLGTILQLLALAGGVFLLYDQKSTELATLKAEVAHVGHQQDADGAALVAANAAQDQRWQVALSELRADIAEVRARLDRLLTPTRP